MVLTDPRHPAANEFSAMPDMGRGGAGVSLRPLMKGVLTQSRRVRRGADASGGGGAQAALAFLCEPCGPAWGMVLTRSSGHRLFWDAAPHSA